MSESNRPNDGRKDDQVDHSKWNLAMEEYKILQQKFDKIGDFRFRVKQWALTLFAGLVIAQVSNPGPPVVAVAVCGLVATFLFWYLEFEQDGHRKKFRWMTIQLEKQFKSGLGYGPSIATSFPSAASEHHRKLERKEWSSSWPRELWKRLEKAASGKRFIEPALKKVAALATAVTFREVFYVLLALLIVVTAVFTYRVSPSKHGQSVATDAPPTAQPPADPLPADPPPADPPPTDPPTGASTPQHRKAL